jgi:glycosyltransferase involved in cell wall biosynthesis
VADLTVVICTHNPRRHLIARAIDALKAQTLARDEWQLVIVDNASDEPVAPSLDLGWHPAARVIREDELGLTAARVRAIRETTTELMLFVDDDNVLREDYLATARDLAKTHTMLGCIGAGVIVPEFEVTPSAEILPHTRLLALREVARSHWSNDPDDGLMPWGPGLLVRRRVAEGFAAVVEEGALNAVIGRRGTSLASGEDEVFGWVAVNQGLGKGVFTELATVHLIPKERTDFNYLLRLHRAQARSFALLHAWQKRPVPTWSRPARLRDVRWHLGRGEFALALQAVGSWLVGRHRVDRYTEQMNDAWDAGLADFAAEKRQVDGKG